ncbi:hypothetical protein DVH24_035727 [Malus domestica]|uniref:Uncharacterized protein n=1 Tax=Malus domestica TaxID=3750 RepID=A0A498JM78_MALDO|nr:hypothetical protein DVH24_035727 [Malus domestica]
MMRSSFLCCNILNNIWTYRTLPQFTNFLRGSTARGLRPVDRLRCICYCRSGETRDLSIHARLLQRPSSCSPSKLHDPRVFRHMLLQELPPQRMQQLLEGPRQLSDDLNLDLAFVSCFPCSCHFVLYSIS